MKDHMFELKRQIISFSSSQICLYYRHFQWAYMVSVINHAIFLQKIVNERLECIKNVEVLFF